MILMDQNFEILDRDIQSKEKLIELAGRTCYKSEDKITKDSANKFVQMITERGHFSVIEHASLCITVPVGFYNDFLLIDRNITKFLKTTTFNQRYLISGNIRAWAEFLLAVRNYSLDIFRSGEIRTIKSLLYVFCKPVFKSILDDKPEDLTFDFSPRIHIVHEKDFLPEERFVHEYVTVKIITNRGITHELVRHRNDTSYSQESTRYVKYSGSMEFIRPVWWGSATENQRQVFQDSLNHAEYNYKELLESGWRPEQAREVLPNALKTEIITTANIAEWKHIFKLRASKAAHPQMRELMTDIKKEFSASVMNIF